LFGKEGSLFGSKSKRSNAKGSEVKGGLPPFVVRGLRKGIKGDFKVERKLAYGRVQRGRLNSGKSVSERKEVLGKREFKEGLDN
jgi:hypothetical protein